MTTDVTQIGTDRAEMLACLQQTMDGVICTSELVAELFRSIGLLIAAELDGKAEVEE